MPSVLSFEQASTLSCAGVTAWNALYGLQDRPLKQGDTVLTQGTGGVSTFAVQFALAAGAKVIATTSSDAKAEFLKNLGVHHVINYKNDPNWGESAKKLTPRGEGVDYVIEVGGPTTIAQSLRAVKMDGVINLIGFVGGLSKDQPNFMDVLVNICTVRGLLVGSKLQFEEMNRAIETNAIMPVADSKAFKLEDLKEGYQYMWDKKHVGKLIVKISD